MPQLVTHESVVGEDSSANGIVGVAHTHGLQRNWTRFDAVEETNAITFFMYEL